MRNPRRRAMTRVGEVLPQPARRSYSHSTSPVPLPVISFGLVTWTV